MPTTERVGTESTGNKTLGGIPTVHYLDFESKGRGQVIRLLFEDAGIAYDDVRYALPDEYEQFKTTQLAQLNPLTTVPIVELKGQVLTQSYPIMRHFARILGTYGGKTEEEVFWADRICDAVIDWRTLFVQAFLAPDAKTAYPKYTETTRKNFLNGIEKLLKDGTLSQRGPYVIGNEITYADFVLYQVLHDESLSKNGRKVLKDGGYTRLVELVDAIESRPNIADFLKSPRYKG